MRDGVDFLSGIRRIGHIERHVFGKRTGGAVIIGRAPVPQHRHRRMQVALLAHVQPAFERKMRGVDDRLVDIACRLRGCKPGLHMYGTGTVASLAPDSIRHFLVLTFRKGRRVRIAVVAGHAAIRNEPVKAGIGHLVSGAEVPPLFLGVPCQGQFEIASTLLYQVRTRSSAAAHYVLYFTDQAMRSFSARSPSEFFEPKTISLPVWTIKEPPLRVLYRHACEIFNHGGRTAWDRTNSPSRAPETPGTAPHDNRNRLHPP